MRRNSAKLVFAFMAMALSFVPTSSALADSENIQSKPKGSPEIQESKLETRDSVPKSEIGNPKSDLLSLHFPSVFKKSFLYKEFNFLTVYSDETGEFDYTPRIPRTSVGLEYFGEFRKDLAINNLFGGLFTLESIDIAPRVEYDPMDDDAELHFYDAWLKLRLKGENSSLRVGHFNLPFGINPVMEPRGQFLLPLEASDFGFKKDWGAAFHSSLGKYDYEVAATLGSGLGIKDRQAGSYLLSGRIGTPTYKDFEYGASFLYGKIPDIMADNILTEDRDKRWRVGLDMVYMYKTHTIFKLEAAGGENENADVFGYLAEVSYIVPKHTKWELKAQFQSWFNNLREDDSDNTYGVIGVAYSLSDSITLGAYYLHELSHVMREEDDMIFLQFFFYGR